MTFRVWVAFLVALLLGLLALVILAPSQNWWAPAALLNLAAGIYVYRAENHLRALAASRGEKYKDDGSLSVWFFVGGVLASFLWGSLKGAGPWTISTVIAGIFAIFAGYLLSEKSDEEAAEAAAHIAATK